MGFQITVQPPTKTGQAATSAINDQKAFSSEAGEPILDAALRQGIMLPYGCRDGACGACRGQILSGTVDHGRAQIHTLSEADRQAGFALLCCATAQSDLSVETREVRKLSDVPIRTLPARVQKMILAAPDVMIIELKLPANERLQFFAGQYIEILLKENKRRDFSLANAPHDDDCLQLHIRRTASGQFTQHVFSGMKERDILRIRGPHGSFFLREESTKPMLLVAGGTGFAPIKSLVEHAIAEHSTRPMHIYWGGLTRADLYLLEHAEQWAKEHAHIKFIPVLSNAATGDDWQGRTGYVHRAAMTDFPDLSAYQVYVCGSPAMVTAAQHDFVSDCHLPETEFFADSFELAADTPNTNTTTQANENTAVI